MRPRNWIAASIVDRSAWIPGLAPSRGPGMTGERTLMTDTRDTIPPSSSARGPSRRARRWSPRISSATPRSSSRRGALLLVAPKAQNSAWRCMAAPSWRPPRTASASSPAATTARSCRPARRRQHRDWRPTPSAAGSITSRPARTARWPGRPASRRSCAPARMPNARSKCRRPSAASPSRRRACGSRSRITTA